MPLASKKAVVETRTKCGFCPARLLTRSVGVQAMAKLLIGKERHAWDSIKEGNMEHRLAKKEAGNRAQDSEMTKRLHEFFKHLEALAALRATY
jgi:hypothetical protein